MPFTPKTDWKDGEVLPASDMNRIEQGIDDANAPVSYNDLTNKPTLLTIGTTATTAKAGNYAPAWGDVTGKPATFTPTIGATATTAMAGNTPLLQIGTTATTAKAGNWTPPNVTTTANGLMLATDKVKLDSLVSGAIVPVDAPVIDVTEPTDAEQVQGEIQKLVNALIEAKVFKNV